MQPMQHQMMGYDRTSAMFSPDGRLLQVEYAKKTVSRGTTAIGMVCKDGVLLVGDKMISDKLIVTSTVKKIMQVDEHIGATATGFVMDGRILIEKAQLIAQQHQVTYGESIDILTLVKEICDIKQAHTLYGGARPFGVSILFAGVNDELSLFLTDPTGIYFEYKATAIGEGEAEIKDMLMKSYKGTITVDEGLRIALKGLKKVLGKDFNMDRIDAAYVDIKDKKFKRIDKKKFSKLT